MASAAWTRKEGKSKSGGLNAKGRASYKGGTLKAPTKSKTSSRRKSFCARMGGMKKKLTSAKTARDPNSRINKSLRKVGLLMRQALLDALEARYEAEVAEAHAIIKIFLENPVGIGEHPQHLDELDKQFEKIANAEEKLEALKSFQIERKEM